jgi:YD repeat-containing protein
VLDGKNSESHLGETSSGVAKRQLWLVLFALLLLLAAAVPVMAAEEAAPTSSEIAPPPPSLQLSAAEAPDFLPDQREIAEGVAAAVREEARREEELESRAATQEREETREAFTDSTAAESKELLTSAFPAQLELLNTDPARFLSDAKIIHTAGEEGAVVSDEGDTSLLEAGIPVRAEDEEGEVGKVDLSLVSADAGFEAKNPLVEVQIPSSAAAPVEVGDEGLGISLAGAAGVAQPFGEQNVFYHDVQPDSDLLVSPISSGVEMFDQLRSPQSPEVLRFQVDLPQGAELRADGSGGAEVLRGDEALAAVPAPSAVDGQGTEVPVELQVEGDALVLDVRHREGDFAYPILVDPIMEDWVNVGASWYEGHNYQALENGAWQGTTEPYEQMRIGTSCLYTCWGSGRGLYVSAPNREYGSEVHAHWAYLAPTFGSYVSQVYLNPLKRDDHNCSREQFAQPHDYEGFWSGSGWEPLQVNAAVNGLFSGAGKGRSFVVGLSSAGGITIPCWRDLGVGGAAVWLDDEQPPAQPVVTGMPAGWLKKASSYTVGVEAYDSGLGVQEVRLIAPGEKRWPWSQTWCTGLYGDRCPASRSGQLTFSTEAFMEGTVPVSINAVSPSGKVGPPRSYELKIDGTAPLISLRGQLAKATAGEGKEELSLPVYNLTVKAEDLLGAGPTTGSGVREVKLFLDGKALTSRAATCTTTSCPSTFEPTFSITLTSLAEGEHTLETRVKDFVGNETPEGTSKIGFEFIPATGMKEEYVLQHFVLPDGHDYSNETEYSGPELAVNVINGNVVYRERDLKVQAPSGDLDLERIYNSQQPTARDGQWGHGWSLAETPEFKPTAAKTTATMVRTSAVTNPVQLPQSQTQTTFDPKLHATIAKAANGGYEVTSATEEEASIFNSSGRIEETRLSSVSPEVAVEPEPVFPVYVESIGSSGTGNGQFNHPADVAVDAANNLWALDKGNARIEKFNEAGEYVRSVASPGTAGGRLTAPSALAVDSSANLWVADTGNNRIEELNEKGEFVLTFGRDVNKTKVEAGGTEAERNLCTAASGNVCQAGTAGTTGAQLKAPQGIAIAADGNLWIADTGNSHIKKFSPTGSLLNNWGAEGSGLGQLKEPTALAVAPDASVWVADTGNNRISQWGLGKTVFTRQVGAEGTGNGQFRQPAAIDVDPSGSVWVGELGNERVQQLSSTGEYVAQYGSASQFSFSNPMGVDADGKGGVWVTDTDHNRLQKLSTNQFVQPVAAQVPAIDYSYSSGLLTKMELEEPEAPDPALAVTSASGLTTSVSSEAGTATYAYTSGNLTSAKDPAGETKYVRDTSNRIKRIELPNGTWAEISYDSIGRTTEVTVSPAGGIAKTTKFWYSTSPRETRVSGGGNPEVVYSIGEDGSVLKWWYAAVPPILESFGGSLWANRNSTSPIENKDHLFYVTAKSQNEIASVQLLVNGTAVVEEATCEDKAQPPDHHCDAVELQWVTNAAAHVPGQLNLEVVATDFLGHQVSERFFVTVPQQPPVDPEAPEPPTFESTKQFREDYGLDRGKSMSKSEQTRLILELLYEWEAQVPTAVTAVANWGIPMRAPELAEMEWRREYTNNAAEVIPQWAEEHAPTSYGGFYIDNKAGGKIYVGFTENQQALVAALKASGSLLNSGQVFEYPVSPVRSVANIEELEQSVATALSTNATANEATIGIELSADSKRIEVGATNPSYVEQFLQSQFGPSAPIVVAAQSPLTYFASRYGNGGPVVAGAALRTEIPGVGVKYCTAGFGARMQRGELLGAPSYLYFVLTAGHCFEKGSSVSREAIRERLPGPIIGEVRRSAFHSSNSFQNPTIDGEAILLKEKELRSHSVLNGDPLTAEPIQGIGRTGSGREVCWSGINGGKNCGTILKMVKRSIEGNRSLLFKVEGPAAEGDSGAPVWDPITHRAVGSITSGEPAVNKSCHRLPNDALWCPRMLFAPLLPRPNKANPAGIAPALGVEILGAG